MLACWVLACSVAMGAQTPQAIFTSDVYAIPMVVRVFERGPFFLIGFEPTDEDRNGLPHKIEIKVKGIRKTLKHTLTIPKR